MTVFRYITKDPIRVALALSVAVHVAALWKMPALRPPPERQATPSGPLIVQLVPPPGPSAVRPQRPPPVERRPAPPPPRAAERAPPPRAAERPPPRPPVIARRDPEPAASPVPRPPPAPAPAVPAPPAAADLASYIETRRRERGESTPAPAAPAPATAEDEAARANRIAAANLGLGRKPEFGPDRRSGGVFDLTYTSYDYAEFLFYGWNKEIRRNTSHKIEVRRGQNPDIRIAVVRRMISIIRDYEQGDFVWESQRLNRDVTLSARPRDTAGLEDFLLKEFFEDPRRPR